ncbi:VWA domain-containing protein [Bordetella hinzii]|uniref:vWA domain-containing protein n=1 Tax=Bordetella hinzii TaxID=103855 RepID=UPI0013EFD311|nr:VWA domain-containing protein [Bordetella hinzii]QII85495.1 VWA domain-containing protein [Bordetella hinzii]
MDIDLSAFHFLRPAWLWLLPLALVLLALWRLRQGAGRWSGHIAPQLLPYLTLGPGGGRGLRPVQVLALMLGLGGLAAAGPTWQRDTPAFLDNTAPLIAAVDLSPSMDANDVPPSRLEAAKHKLRDLVERRKGARTGLIAYAGSAHLVLPPTDDAALLAVFIDALDTQLIARPGRDVGAVRALAARVLAAEQAGGTLLLLTDGGSRQTGSREAKVEMQTMVLAVGARNVGGVLDGQGRPRTDAQGNPVSDDFDAQALRTLARSLDAPLASLTAGGDDLDWVERYAQRHFQAVQGKGEANWKDAGYWLCWPLALLALLSLRRGGGVAWMLALAAVLAAPPAPVQAGALADAFFTPDQQGWRAFERGDFKQAAERFEDPYWKGRAAYEGGQYPAALAAFARLRTPEGWFYQGNTQVKLHHYDAARQAYRQALALKPDWEAARFNLRIVESLLSAMAEEDEGQGADKPDQTTVDKGAAQGRERTPAAGQAVSEADWLRNLSLSPAQFLRGKFAIEDAKP